MEVGKDHLLTHGLTVASCRVACNTLTADQLEAVFDSAEGDATVMSFLDQWRFLNASRSRRNARRQPESGKLFIFLGDLDWVSRCQISFEGVTLYVLEVDVSLSAYTTPGERELYPCGSNESDRHCGRRLVTRIS